MVKKVKYEEIKKILSTNEGLWFLCISKHYHKNQISCARLSELFKVPINKLKELCLKLEELGFLKTHKIGTELEIELVLNDDENIKHIFDEIIWDNKIEYGNIYKRFITMEFMDFLNGK